MAQVSGVLTPYVDSVTATTISSTALTLVDLNFSQAQVDAADVVHVRVYDQTIRYRYARSATATSTTGYAVDAGQEFELSGKQIIAGFTIIAETTDATVWITLSTFGIAPIA